MTQNRHNAIRLTGNKYAIDGATPVVRGDKLHVQVIGENFPTVVTTTMIVAVVVARANIDVAIQTIQREEGVKFVEVHVLAIPLHGLSTG